MLEQLLTIARNTFLQSIRQPIYMILLLVAALVLVLSPSLSAYTLDDDNKLLIDMGLSTLFLAGLFIAAFTATNVVWAEIESKTVLSVVSKPIARPLFIVGKYLGVAAAMTLAFWVMAIMLLLTLRHGVMQTAGDKFDGPVILFGLLAWGGSALIAAIGNYLYRWVFTSSFVFNLVIWLTLSLLLVLLIGKGWHFQPIAAEFGLEGKLLGGQVLWVMLLVFEAVLLISAVALAASTRLNQILTLLVCLLVFAAGLMIQSLAGPDSRLPGWDQVAGVGQTFGWLTAKFFYAILPNMQFFWLTDALSEGTLIPAWHVVLVSGYAGLQIVALMGLSVVLFQTREVG